MTRQTRMLVWLTAGCAAIVAPVLLLLPDRTMPPAGKMVAAPISLNLAPQLDAALKQRLFSQPITETRLLAEEPDDPESGLEPPELVGIVGRLPDNAVALVRTADDRTRTLAIRDSIDGWRLAALSIDAAFFTRGGEHVRVGLPTDR